MEKQNKLLRAGFGLFSLSVSFLLVFYAVNVIYGSDASYWLRNFAYVAGGYGLANTYILSWAWRNGAKWTVTANMVIGVCLFGVVLVDLYREGFSGGMQLAGLLGLAFVLAINWYAIKVLCQTADK